MEKRERPPKAFAEFAGIRALMDSSGRVPVEKGEAARVSFYADRMKIMVRRKVDGRIVRQFFDPDALADVNRQAREWNREGFEKGALFGGTTKEEVAALQVWRDFYKHETAAGRTPRKLADILRDAVQREVQATETISFEAAAREFIDYKERSGAWANSERYARRFKLLASVLKKSVPAKKGENAGTRRVSKTLGEISGKEVEEAIILCLSKRKSTKIKANSICHWGGGVKNLFDWWYEKENASRAITEQLRNPLENWTLPKIANFEDPELMTLADVRTLLNDLWKNEPVALPMVLVQLFCGVRNAEACRLRWKDFRGDVGERTIFLSKSITKTKTSRNVPVPENLEKWLTALLAAGVISCARENFLYPEDTERKRMKKVNDAIDRARRRVSFAKPENAFRHTAVSAMCALYDEFKAASWAGHDRRIQGEFYKSAMSAREAKDFFSINPPVDVAKLCVFSRERVAADGGAGTGNASAVA